MNYIYQYTKQTPAHGIRRDGANYVTYCACGWECNPTGDPFAYRSWLFRHVVTNHLKEHDSDYCAYCIVMLVEIFEPIWDAAKKGTAISSSAARLRWSRWSIRRP